MRALVLSAVMLAACSTLWRQAAVATSSTGQRLCAKHHVPLITARGYEPPQGVFTHDNMDRPFYNIVGESSPNRIPDYQTLRRSKLQCVPSVIAYCPLCEKELEDRLRVQDEAAARKFAAYALPIYGGGGVATKPPYQVSFRGGTWTVTCSLADGRTATIKISREEGRVLSTHYSRGSPSQVMQRTGS
ncbi:MAG TPA: hypothetical protein VNW72_09225 [Chthoniobacterales bacterium]|jgi:hypothetical protein|nr:hypothetical protein [Chthoniobacterales bacterium]